MTSQEDAESIPLLNSFLYTTEVEEPVEETTVVILSSPASPIPEDEEEEEEQEVDCNIMNKNLFNKKFGYKLSTCINISFRYD
jgi:hypothetical protein